MSAPTLEKTPPAAAPPRRRSRGPAVRRTATSYTMLAPALVLFGVFMLYPLYRAVGISLTDSTGIGASEFVGLDNYTEMFLDARFWRAALNTAVLALVSVPVSLAAGLGIALLLRDKLPARGFLRAVFLAPYVLSGVVVAMLGRWLFDQNVGVTNRLLDVVGLGPVDWQSSPGPAAISVFVVLLWSRTGLAVVIYLAALQGVDGDVLEAAELDGAGARQRLRLVVWPLLRPTTFLLTVLLVIETFQVFDVVYVMTGGGPRGGTELLVTYAYAQGFTARREGYGSAVGVLVFIVILGATALWYRSQRKAEEEL